jgi:hypothetical protein
MVALLTQQQTLTFKLIPKIDDALKPDVIKWSAFYEHRIKMGTVGFVPILETNIVNPFNVSDTESHFSPRSFRGEVHAHSGEVSGINSTAVPLLTKVQLSHGS